MRGKRAGMREKTGMRKKKRCRQDVCTPNIKKTSGGRYYGTR